MRRFVTVVAVLVTLSTGGCMSQPEPKDSAASLREARSTIVAELKKVAADLSTGGATVAEASGRYASCGSAPTNAIEYRSGARVTGDDAPVADRIKAAVATLKAQGWAVTDEQYTDDPYPYARLERAGLRLSLDPDARRGSDAMTFALAGDCIRTDKGQDDEFSGTEEIDVP